MSKEEKSLFCKKGFARRTRRNYVLLSLLLFVPSIVYLYNPSITFTSKTDGKTCKLHELDPWDKTMSQYLKSPSTLNCASNKFSILYIDGTGILQFNKSAILHYSLTSLKCVYMLIHRVDGDSDIKQDDEIPFKPPIFINHRVFRVLCRNASSETVYDFVHFNVMSNNSDVRKKRVGYESDDKFSVLVFGLDSASRSHALRKLPKSYKYLKETLGAFDFRGYMKVGLNSFPNVIPLLTGEEHYQYRMENILKAYLDNVPFLWKEEVTKNYATFYSEDRPDISTLNYLQSGFRKAPVDYYFRPFGLAMDTINPVIMEPLGKSSWWCYGNKEHFLLQIDYLKRFITKYTKRLKFSYLWNNQLGHEDFISLGLGDQPLYEFLQWMKSNGHLERSILIVGSDHGFRLGGASSTYIGRIENNMPFLMVYIPEILKMKYPWLQKNLEYNTDKLISPFDIHETLMDVLYGRFSEKRLDNVYKKRTNRSLFSKIPKTRTCVDAGIPPQYCTCYDSTSVSVSKPLVVRLGKFLVQHLNSRLHQYRDKCRELTLLNITEAKVMYTAEGDSDNDHIEREPGFFKRLLGNTETDDSGRYTLMLYTKPNNGLIDVMIDYQKHAADGTEHKMLVIGDPVRANKYGNQSHCLTDTILRQYCLCKDVNILDL